MIFLPANFRWPETIKTPPAVTETCGFSSAACWYNGMATTCRRAYDEPCKNVL